MFYDTGEVALHAQGRLRKDESKPAKVLSSQGLRGFESLPLRACENILL